MGMPLATDRLGRDDRILAAVERCAQVRPCVLKGFYVEEGLVVVTLYMLDQHDENGNIIRARETCRLTFPVNGDGPRRRRAF